MALHDLTYYRITLTMIDDQSPKLNDKGFVTFDFDMDDDEQLYRGLKVDNPAKEEARDVARTYLSTYLEAKDVIHDNFSIFTYPKIQGFIDNRQATKATSSIDKQSNIKVAYEHLQTKELKVTNTQLVKFRQLYKEIPVYGSLATVELGKENELIGISANFGQPNGVSPKPSVGYQDIKDFVYQTINPKEDVSQDLDLDLSLFYYFDSMKQKWRLVYIVETKIKQKSFKEMSSTRPNLVDYIVDAHSKEVISELPHVRTLTAMSINNR